MEKILVISTMYPNNKNQTFGIFVKNQVEELRKRGFQVDVAAISDPRTGRRFIVKKYFRWIVQIISILLKKGREYDVIHAHYVFPSGWLALFFKKRFNTRVIVTAHGGDLDKMAKKSAFFFKRTKLVLHEADHVIAVGEELKHDMVSMFGVGNRGITVLNMGVDRNVFLPMNKVNARNAVKIPQTSTMVLFVGNIIKAKGITELASVYNNLKEKHDNLELHLIGAQKELTFVQWLENNYADITIHPPMNQEKIAKWMAAADVFVIPSYMEGFGLVALEAMSCHTPVVGSNVGGLKYLLNEGAGVLVKPKNKKSLSDGIESVLNNDSLSNELVKNGEEKAQMFDQERLIGQLIKLYQRE